MNVSKLLGVGCTAKVLNAAIVVVAGALWRLYRIKYVTVARSVLPAGIFTTTT